MDMMKKTVTVKEDQLACTMGSGSLRVLATPAVVALMENAAAALAQEILDNEMLTTVGTMIAIEHTSPTPTGLRLPPMIKREKSQRARIRASA